MASEAVVLPCINRFVDQAVDQNLAGIVAYGCRNNVFFLDVSKTIPVILESMCVYEQLRSRIIALSFNKSEDTQLIAVASEDKVLIIWDLQTRTCVASDILTEPVYIMEWIYGSATTFVLVCKKKSLFKFNVEKNKPSKINIDLDLQPTVLRSNPKQPHVMAVGLINGAIALLNIEQEQLLQKLLGHSQEITSLSWSPVDLDLLVSGSSDLTVRLWRKGNEKAEATFAFKAPFSRNRDPDKTKMRLKVIAHPRNPDIVLCCNLKGDMGEVNACNKIKPKFTPYLAPNFESCKSPCGLLTGVRKSDGEENVVLFCFDIYKFSVWDFSEKRHHISIPFLLGYVFNLEPSNLNPNLLAICSGDGVLRVCNSQSENGHVDMRSVYIHYKTKILSVAWHPTIENIIAFATNEGRIGIIDMCKKRVSFTYETHHADAVYSLSWGPCEKALTSTGDEKEMYLYSCGGAAILIHGYPSQEKTLNFDDLVECPAGVESFEKTYCAMIWKSDFSCFCVGSFTGVVSVFDPKFVLLIQYHLQSHAVECLRWHPESTYMSPTGSSYNCWLACSGAGPDIYICDSSNIFEPKKSYRETSLKTLIGHKFRIYSLCWSPHTDGHLASTSRDGTVLIWDAIAGTVLATYTLHKYAVQAVYWSVFDKDVMYSGGQDSAVKIWRISQQSIQAPPEKAFQRKPLRKNVAATNELKMKVESDEKNSKASTEDAASKSANKDSESPSEEKAENDQSPDVNWPKRKLKPYNLDYITGKKFGPLFPFYDVAKPNQEVPEDCLKLAEFISEKQSSNTDSIQEPSPPEWSEDEVISLGLFTDQLTALRMLETQAELHRNNGDYVYGETISVMAGDTKTLLLESAAKGRLSSSLVSFAPTVSHSFWLEMCEKYAVQLIAEKNPYKASSYFLMANKVYEAINTLAEKGNPVDALALAKARLPDSDPLTVKVLHMCGKRFRHTGHLGGELKCALATNQPLKAAVTLASKGDAKLLSIASTICRKCGHHQEADLYLFQCVEKYLVESNWNALNALQQDNPELEVYKPFFVVHEIFHEHLQALKKQDRFLMKDIFPSDNEVSEVTFWKGHTCLETKQSFMEYIVVQLLSKDLLLTEQSSIRKLLDALNTFLKQRKASNVASVAHIMIAISITKFIFFCILGDFQNANEVFIKIFESSYDIYFLPKVVCAILLPMRIRWHSNTGNISYEGIADAISEACSFVPILHFDRIYRSVQELIPSYNVRYVLHHDFTNYDFKNDLKSIALKVVSDLSTEGIDENILMYLVTSITNDLGKMVTNKKLKLDCRSGRFNTDGSALKKSVNIRASSAISEDLSRSYDISKNNAMAEPQSSKRTSLAFTKLSPEEITCQLIMLDVEAEERKKYLIRRAKDDCKNRNEADGFVNEEKQGVKSSADGMESGKNYDDFHQVNGGKLRSPLLDSAEVDFFLFDKSVPRLTFNQVRNNNIDCKENDDEVIHETKTGKADLGTNINDCKDIFSDILKVPSNGVSHGIKTESLKLDANGCENDASLNLCDTSEVPNDEVSHESSTKSAALKTDLNDHEEDESVNLCDKNAIIFEERNGSEVGIHDSHTRCLDAVSAFYHVMKFIVFHICKDKFALLFYLKQRLKVLLQSRASVELAKFSLKLNQPGISDHSQKTKAKRVPKSLESTETSDNNPLLDNLNQSNQSPDSEVAFNEHLEGNAEVPAADLDLAATIQLDSVVNDGTDESSYESAKSDVSDKGSSAVTPKEKELDQINSVADDTYDATQYFKDVVPLKSNDFAPDVLSESDELVLQQCIDIFHTSEHPSYPSPFDVIPKILQILYIVNEQSGCPIVREKLHALIDEVIAWSQIFTIGEINYVCEICEKSVI